MRLTDPETGEMGPRGAGKLYKEGNGTISGGREGWNDAPRLARQGVRVPAADAIARTIW